MDHTEPKINIELHGGPDWVPRMVSVGARQIVLGHLTIPFIAGTERFVFDCRVKRIGGRKAATVVCGKTMVVE